MKTGRGVVWPYLLLSVSLFGALGFGWYQTRQKNQLALDNENKYMSAFHKLKWTSENIEERTSKLMASNDMHLQEALLADLRVFSAQAVEHMSVLPFTNLNTPRIENFLNTISLRSDEFHEKLNRGQPLSTAEWNQLTEIRRQSVAFEAELGRLLGLVGNNRLRWSDTVRVTGPSQSGSATTPITESVVHLDTALKPPPGEENSLAPAPMAPLNRPHIDPGAPVQPAAAVQSIRQFIDMPLKADPVLTGRSDPADIEHTFSLYFFDAQKVNGTPLTFGVSIHGGHVIYMLDGRPVTDKRVTPPELIAKAQQMLQKWQYPPVELVSHAENDGTLVMEFSPIKDGVALQTENIRMSLAMDNAELVGFDARSYWLNRKVRNLTAARLTADEAQKRISPRLQVERKPHLALIADLRSQERLVYDVMARLEDQRYHVFVDASTGEEVNLLRIEGDPAPPLGDAPTSSPR